MGAEPQMNRYYFWCHACAFKWTLEMASEIACLPSFIFITFTYPIDTILDYLWLFLEDCKTVLSQI